jgi:hypothetical protein
VSTLTRSISRPLTWPLLGALGNDPGAGPVAPTPFEPTFVGAAPSVTNAAYPALGAQHVYQAYSSGLQILDQDTLEEVANLSDTTNLNGAHACAITADETWAFVTCEGGTSLTSVDISDKANPAVSHRFRGQTAGTSLGGAQMVAIDETNHVAAVANYTRDSVAFVDITDPTAMTWLGEFRGATGGTTLNQCRRVSLWPEEQICFFCCDATGSGVHRVGAVSYDPGNSVELWSIATGEATNAVLVESARGVFFDADNHILWVCASGDSPFLGTFSAWQLDPDNPANKPSLLGYYEGFNLGGGTGFSQIDSMTAQRSVAFITGTGDKRYAIVPAETPNNITVLDVTDPSAMARKGVVRDTDHLNAPLGIAINADGYAFVTSLSSADPRGVTKWDLHIQ